MSKAEVVQVSGRGTNVDFTIDDSSPFDQVTRGLQRYLVENRGLWSKGSIGVNAGRWMLSGEQLGRIKEVIESESGLTVNRFWCSPDHLDRANNQTNGTATKEPITKGFTPKQATAELRQLRQLRQRPPPCGPNSRSPSREALPRGCQPRHYSLRPLSALGNRSTIRGMWWCYPM